MIRLIAIVVILFVTSVGCNQQQEESNDATLQAAPESSAVKKQVKATIAMQLGLDESAFELSDAIQEKLGADELDMVELVMELEEEFNITIPDDKVLREGSSVDLSGEDFARIVEDQLSK